MSLEAWNNICALLRPTRGTLCYHQMTLTVRGESFVDGLRVAQSVVRTQKAEMKMCSCA